MNQETSYNKSKISWWHILLLGLCLITLAPRTIAHEGPPFPIIVDEEVGPYLVSVWTDPDIGIGTFFVVIDPEPGNDVSDVKSIKIGVKPTSGRLDEAMYTAQSQEVRQGARYIAEVEFDKGEMWKVRILLEGEGWDGELTSEVEATPDGSIGPIAVVIYALPFLAVGFLWVRAIMRRRETVEEEDDNKVGT